jgi:hypothetical protein
MKYKVGDIVQFEKDCVLPARGYIAAGSRWRVKEVEENYYELWYRDEHLPDMTERIEYKLVDFMLLINKKCLAYNINEI